MAKRFYECVEVRAIENRFSIYLDEAALRTPAKTALLLPYQKLATALAAEWQAQGEEIKPDTMPLMRYVATAIDRITPNPDLAIKEFISFGQMDLLAFRASNPSPLVNKQNELWNPPLKWAAENHGLHITPTDTLAPPDIEAAALATAAGENPFRLAGLAYGAALLGSAILALMVMEGAMDATQAYQTAFLDDIFQQTQWGEDEEAQARLAKIMLEIETLVVYSDSIRED